MAQWIEQFTRDVILLGRKAALAFFFLKGGLPGPALAEGGRWPAGLGRDGLKRIKVDDLILCKKARGDQ